MTEIYAFGVGIATSRDNGQVLDCYFPAPLKQPGPTQASLIARLFPEGSSAVSPEVLREYLDACEDPGQEPLRALLESEAVLTFAGQD